MTTIADSLAKAKTRPRFRLQFSLGTLLMFMFYCCILLGIVVWARQRIQMEKERADAALEQLQAEKVKAAEKLIETQIKALIDQGEAAAKRERLKAQLFDLQWLLRDHEEETARLGRECTRER